MSLSQIFIILKQYFKQFFLPIIGSTDHKATWVIKHHVVDGSIVTFLDQGMSEDSLHSFKAGNLLIFKISEGICRKISKMEILSLKQQVLYQTTDGVGSKGES